MTSTPSTPPPTSPLPTAANAGVSVFLSGIAALFTNAGGEVASLWNKVEAGITDAEAGLSVVEVGILDAVPALVTAADAGLSAIKTAGADIVAGVETGITDGEQVLQNLLNIFQTTGSQGPGGTTTP